MTKLSSQVTTAGLNCSSRVCGYAQCDTKCACALRHPSAAASISNTHHIMQPIIIIDVTESTNLAQIFIYIRPSIGIDQKVQLWTIILVFVPHEYFPSYAHANIYPKILRSFLWRLWHRAMQQLRFISARVLSRGRQSRVS